MIFLNFNFLDLYENLIKFLSSYTKCFNCRSLCMLYILVNLRKFLSKNGLYIVKLSKIDTLLSVYSA